MRKNIFFIVFIILCAVSCTEKKSNFINTVHLKGQLFGLDREYRAKEAGYRILRLEAMRTCCLIWVARMCV